VESRASEICEIDFRNPAKEQVIKPFLIPLFERLSVQSLLIVFGIRGLRTRQSRASPGRRVTVFVLAEGDVIRVGIQTLGTANYVLYSVISHTAIWPITGPKQSAYPTIEIPEWPFPLPPDLPNAFQSICEIKSPLLLRLSGQRELLHEHHPG
jgi:hypothetical protein